MMNEPASPRTLVPAGKIGLAVMAALCLMLSCRSALADDACEQAGAAADVLAEKIERILSVGPVSTPAIGALRGRKYFGLRADVPNREDLRRRAAPVTTNSCRYVVQRVKALLAADVIPKDLADRLISVRAWPYLEVSSLLTVYAVGDTKVWIRDRGEGLEVAFVSQATATPPHNPTEAEQVFRLLHRYLAEPMRPADSAAMNLRQMKMNGVPFCMGHYKVPPRTFEIGGYDRKGPTVIVFWTDGRYLKTHCPEAPTWIPEDGFTWAGDAEKGLLPPPKR